MTLLKYEFMSTKYNAGVRHLGSMVFLEVKKKIEMGTVVDTLDYKSIQYPERHQQRGKDVSCNVEQW